MRICAVQNRQTFSGNVYKTKGISLIDSFSVDEILEKKDIEKSKQIRAIK